MEKLLSNRPSRLLYFCAYVVILAAVVCVPTARGIDLAICIFVGIAGLAAMWLFRPTDMLGPDAFIVVNLASVSLAFLLGRYPRVLQSHPSVAIWLAIALVVCLAGFVICILRIKFGYLF